MRLQVVVAVIMVLAVFTVANGSPRVSELVRDCYRACANCAETYGLSNYNTRLCAQDCDKNKGDPSLRDDDCANKKYHIVKEKNDKKSRKD